MKRRNDLAARAAALAGAALIGSTVLTGCGNRTPAPGEPSEVTGQNGGQESVIGKLLEFIPFLNQPMAVYGPPPEETPNGGTEQDTTAAPDGDFDPSDNEPAPVYGPPPAPAE